MSFHALRRYEDATGVPTVEFRLRDDLLIDEPFLDWNRMMRIQKWCAENCAFEYRVCLSHVYFGDSVDMEMCYLAFR